MATRIGPRSVKDATRFTSTIPHAMSKTSAAADRATASATARASSARNPGETPEQRVRRLRQAHIAAQKAQVSQTDRIIDVSRRFFDAAHRWTVGGIVIFTAVAGVVSVYSVWDMLQYNRARRAEWIQAQKKLEADSLAAARIAYLRGDATEEQILLVEEANREAQETGIKLPPLLSPPEHRTHFEEHVKPTFSRKEDTEQTRTGKGIIGVVSGFFGASRTVEDSSSVQEGAASRVISSIESTAKNAWEVEKHNQINGGSLDQTGLSRASAKSANKQSWWPW